MRPWTNERHRSPDRTFTLYVTEMANKTIMLNATTNLKDPKRAPRDVQDTERPERPRGKATMAANLIGLATIGLGPLSQMDMLRCHPEPGPHLPPPMKTKKVNCLLAPACRFGRVGLPFVTWCTEIAQHPAPCTDAVRTWL